MTSKAKTEKLHQNEQGIVAIVVTMIIMIVLTLLVTGFAQLARREQRSSLDRQLSTQAFYAAESGINDAQRAIKDPAFTNPLPYDGQKDDCGTISGVASLSSNNLGLNISYPCLLINKKLKNSIVDLSTDKSDIQDLKSYSRSPEVPTALNTIKVSWKHTDITIKSIRPSGPLPNSSGWGSNVGMIRIDVVPYTGTFSAASLQSAMFTVFLRPSSGGGTTIAYLDPAAQGDVVDVPCDGTTGVCKVDIVGLSGTNHIVRMKAIYQPSTVVLCANLCDGETIFIGNQVEVDSTGKAGDILKRLKVRIPKEPDSGATDIPEFTLDSSADICKKIEVTPTSFVPGCNYL
jgi:Tfp pilus assembly protein PilX